MGPHEPHDRHGELDNVEGWLMDRLAEPFQDIRFNRAGNSSVDGWCRARDLAKPGQQHAGQPNHPTAAILGGETDEFLEGSALEVIGRCRVLKQIP